jgi:hypothetical protein
VVAVGFGTLIVCPNVSVVNTVNSDATNSTTKARKLRILRIAVIDTPFQKRFCCSLKLERIAKFTKKPEVSEIGWKSDSHIPAVIPLNVPFRKYYSITNSIFLPVFLARCFFGILEDGGTMVVAAWYHSPGFWDRA